MYRIEFESSDSQRGSAAISPWATKDLARRECRRTWGKAPAKTGVWLTVAKGQRVRIVKEG